MTGVARSTLLDEARAILPQMVAVRRRIHAEPEIGLDLPRTAATVVAEPSMAVGAALYAAVATRHLGGK